MVAATCTQARACGLRVGVALAPETPAARVYGLVEAGAVDMVGGAGWAWATEGLRSYCWREMMTGGGLSMYNQLAHPRLPCMQQLQQFLG